MLTELAPHEAERFFNMLELSAVKLIAIAGFSSRTGDEAMAQSYYSTYVELDGVMEDLAALMPIPIPDLDSVTAERMRVSVPG